MLGLPRGPWRIPDYAETPKLIFDPKRKVQGIYAVEYFLFISDKMKSLLEEFAPKSCEYLLCETEFSNGKPGPRIWLCTVVDSYRKAVDVENSPLIRVTRSGGYMISSGAMVPLATTKEAPAVRSPPFEGASRSPMKRGCAQAPAPTRTQMAPRPRATPSFAFIWSY